MNQTEVLDLNNPVWVFALDFYGRPGVAESCLAIQDESGADIVALVVILYAWSRLGILLSESEGVQLRAEMQGWREATVLPLRQIRRSIKAPRSDIPYATKEILRDQVKRAELLAEQIQIASANAWFSHLRNTGHSSEPYPASELLLAKPSDLPMSEVCSQALDLISQTARDMRQ